MIKFKKIKMGIGLSALYLMFASPVNADISNMEAFFNEVGVYSNSSSPKSFQGQTRGYMTGGSLMMRIPEKNYQLATLSPPKISASCGGIDAFAGAFSFIDSDQLVQMLQNIGNNAAGAVFQLALGSVSPQLESVMKYFQDMANKINALNINSCEAAKGIVSAALPDQLSSNFFNELREKGSNVLGVASDWSGMKEAFSARPEEIRTTKEALTNPSSPLSEEEKFLLNPGNLIWRALGKLMINGASISYDEKRLIQSLVGTVVIKMGDGDPATLEETYFPPLIQDPIKALMGKDVTSEVDISTYVCDNETDCIITVNNRSLTTVSTLRKVINQKVNQTRNKVKDRDPGGISSNDYEVINMSSLPIWTMIESEYRTGGILGTLDNAEELIAISYTKALLLRTLKGVNWGLQTLKTGGNEGIIGSVEKLEENIIRITKMINESEYQARIKFQVFLTARAALDNEAAKVKWMTLNNIKNVVNK